MESKKKRRLSTSDDDGSSEAEVKYSKKEVMTLLDSKFATPLDYLIQSYLNIFEDSNFSLGKSFRIRLNNIIFNNLPKIVENLTIFVLSPKISQIVNENLGTTKYVSCIYHHDSKFHPFPTLIQYFSLNDGIQHKILDYSENPLHSLYKHRLLNKLIGYCGEYLYIDPQIRNHKSDRLESMKTLLRKYPYYLPYSDEIVDRIFIILEDSLPVSVSDLLAKLGQVVTTLPNLPRIGTLLKELYREWSENNDGTNILASNYTKFVINHFHKIRHFLTHYTLPNFLEKVKEEDTLYILFLVRQIYLDIKQLEITENCVLLYYNQLKQIRYTFELYENYTEHMLIKDFMANDGTLSKCYEQANAFIPLLEKISFCCKRATDFIEPLLEKLSFCEAFMWVLLDQSEIDVNLVHSSFHEKEKSKCNGCDMYPKLSKEVQIVNDIIAKEQFLFSQSTELKASQKWMRILKNSNLLLISDLIVYIFTLPAAFNLLPLSIDKLVTHSHYAQAKNIVKFNLIKNEEAFLSNFKEIFKNDYEEIRNIIKEFKISTLID